MFCQLGPKNGITGLFDIFTDVCQGCILSPFLFLLVMDFIMRKTMNCPLFGIGWNEERLRGLEFADEVGLMSHTRGLARHNEHVDCQCGEIWPKHQ